MPRHGLLAAKVPQALAALGALIILAVGLAGAPIRLEAAPTAQGATTGETIFRQKCAACHTIGGGRLVGPDLKGVTAQRDAAWLKAFIATPDKALAAGDPIATQLLKESNNVPMPNLGLSPREVDEILAFLAAQDGAAAPTTPATPAPAAPTPPAALPAGDAAQGARLFTGAAKLQGGGTPCIACHSVAGAAALGGGALGPDLTQVQTRYGGQQGLAAVLAGLPFPSMQSIYATRPLTPAEQADLLAFFARADQEGRPPLTQRHLLFILGGGVGLAGVLFGGMAFFWPRQRLSIAQRLRKYGKL